MTYQQAITTQEEALSHLFFHCCFNDNAFNDEELKTITDKLVTVGLHTNLNFKDEVVKYRAYRTELTDETEYLRYLLQLIVPVNELALFSYCIELCLGDAFLGPQEETLLKKIAQLLEIEEQQQDVIVKLMVQRRIVETQKLF